MAENAVGAVAEWLESWRTSKGAYNGFVVHRFRNKRMFRIHDTAWTQAAMIRAFANLWERSGNEKWHERMVLAADLQCSRIRRDTGRYRFAGHEDDRFCSLVHCALADVALLRAALLTDAGRRERYVDAAKTNLDRYCLDRLWVPEERAFKFSEVDYWSPTENRYVVNFNTMGAEALLKLHGITQESKYRDYALQIGEWLIRRCGVASSYHERLLAGRTTVLDDPGGQWMAPGGLAYQYTATQQTPDNCILIYAGLALRGLCALYKETHDDRVAEIIREDVSFILAMRDPDTRLFYHTTDKGRVVRWPQFVSGAGMILVGLHEARETLKEDWDWGDTLDAILRRQYGNGGFPGFIGKAVVSPPREVWEDAVATPNWNAQMLEYLTLIAQPLESDGRRRAAWIVRPGFCYVDTPGMAFVLSYAPADFSCVYLAWKRWSYSLVYLSPYALVHSTMRFLRSCVLACMRAVHPGMPDKVARLFGRK